MSNLVILEKVGSQDPIFDVVCPEGTVGGGLLVLGVRNDNGTYAGAANAAATDKMMVYFSFTYKKQQHLTVVSFLNI
jgi:hypothetical protein